jgi:heme exporter protein D
VITGVTCFAYLPLVFLAVIMAFLCLMISVVASVMDAAVTLQEENALTI